MNARLTVWQDDEIIVEGIPADINLMPVDIVNHWLNANDGRYVYEFETKIGPGHVELRWIDSIGRNDAEYAMKARIDYE